MGELIFHSGLGLNAVNVLDKWLGKLRGRLSILAIIMGVIIGALSGSTIATCALLGTILLPEMLKRGYSKNMSLGPLMGVGTVDALIPPNALTVVLASLANIDVGQLLMAGICRASSCLASTSSTSYYGVASNLKKRRCMKCPMFL